MEHLGILHHFLGIEVQRSPTGIFISQSKYAYDFLTKSSMLSCTPYGSPYNYTSKASAKSSELLPDPTTYKSIMGALQYLTLTRPDLSFVVNQDCQRMHNPTPADFIALKRILRYLKGTFSFGVVFK